MLFHPKQHLLRRRRRASQLTPQSSPADFAKNFGCLTRVFLPSFFQVAVTFWSPKWGSLIHLKRSLEPPKKVTRKNLVFLEFFKNGSLFRTFLKQFCSINLPFFGGGSWNHKADLTHLHLLCYFLSTDPQRFWRFGVVMNPWLLGSFVLKIDGLADWLVDWLIDWLIGWLTDWLIVCSGLISLHSTLDFPHESPWNRFMRSPASWIF